MTHKSCTGEKTASVITQADTKAVTRATTLTVSWNWRNLLILSYIFLPHLTAFTIDAKLSSSIIISAAYLATSVPLIPIAKPTLAFLRAGASFVPSPVTATTSLHYFSPVTIRYLSYGRERAIIFRDLIILLNAAWSPRCSCNIFFGFFGSVFLTSPPTCLSKSYP